MIRESNEFFSCTITAVDDGGEATVEYAPYREALFPKATFVVYEHKGRHYYPLTLEFRLVDNNLLYIIEELKTDSMSETFRILSSSVEKEEEWSTTFELVVVHLLRPPHFAHRLRDNFKVDNVTRHVYE